MATVYQQCPFCDRVFELGPADYQPMTLHIRVAHIGERGRSSKKWSERRLEG